MLCPADTPEGESCGLVKNLALMTHVTTGGVELLGGSWGMCAHADVRMLMCACCITNRQRVRPVHGGCSIRASALRHGWAHLQHPLTHLPLGSADGEEAPLARLCVLLGVEPTATLAVGELHAPRTARVFLNGQLLGVTRRPHRLVSRRCRPPTASFWACACSFFWGGELCPHSRLKRCCGGV